MFCLGMLGPESIVGYPEFVTGLCYTEAAVLHRIWEQRYAQYEHALETGRLDVKVQKLGFAFLL